MNTLRRRMMTEAAEQGTKLYITSDNGYTSVSNYISTPITMPSNSKIVAEVYINPNGNDVRYFDFTSNKTSVRKTTNYQLAYHTHGNDWYCVTNVGTLYAIVKIELNRKDSLVYATLEDGSLRTSNQPRTWQNKTTDLRIFLTSGCRVHRVTQYNNSGGIVHDLIATEDNNGSACMQDLVGGAYYYPTENAYLIQR